MRHVAGTVDGQAGVVATTYEPEFAALNQVDGIAVKAVLPQKTRGRAEGAVLQRHDDHAVI